LKVRVQIGYNNVRFIHSHSIPAALERKAEGWKSRTRLPNLVPFAALCLQTLEVV